MTQPSFMLIDEIMEDEPPPPPSFNDLIELNLFPTEETPCGDVIELYYTNKVIRQSLLDTDNNTKPNALFRHAYDIFHKINTFIYQFSAGDATRVPSYVTNIMARVQKGFLKFEPYGDIPFTIEAYRNFCDHFRLKLNWFAYNAQRLNTNRHPVFRAFPSNMEWTEWLKWENLEELE